MKTALNIAFLFLAFSSLALSNATKTASDGRLMGTVTSSQGKPLEFVTVGIQALSTGDVTDTDGRFQINQLPFGTYEVTASSVGYTSLSKRILIDEENSSLVIDFVLQELTTGLQEVMVVSGTMKEVSKLQSPVPVEVYAETFFKANPTPSVFEALTNVNGVRPQINCNICNTGDIHINGLEGPYTMVLIDGMPIVSGLSTVYGLTGIPQTLIERIEVVKGPASTLYGSEAVGGLINIITKRPGNAPRVAVDVFGTSWGEVNTDLGIGYAVGEKVQALMGINYFNYQNPIDNNNDGFTDITLQDRISFFNKFKFNLKNNRTLSLAARYVYEDRWGGQMNWEKENRGGTDVYGESIYTSRWEVFGTYDLPTRENLRLQFSANGHDQNSVYGDTPYLALQHVVFGQLTWDKSIGRHDLLTGLTYRYTSLDDNTPATAANDINAPAVIHLPGLFIQDEIAINDYHSLLLGTRLDYNSVHGRILSPRINYKWNSSDQRSIVRLSAGNGYRVANVFTEDHAALTGAREVVFTEELQPETSWNVNLNVTKKFYTTNEMYIGLDATAFYTHFGNAILPDYESNPNQIIYWNLDGTAVSQGLSLNLDMNWISGLKVMAGGTLMDVSVTENDETIRQVLTERFSGVWNIGYTFPALSLTVDYTGNLFAPMRLPLLGPLDDRPDFSPWYSIQNIQLTKKIKRNWEIYGGVKNLLNFTPPENSIARAFDPFDTGVVFDPNGQVVPTASNPNALSFDPTYMFAPNQGIRGFLGIRYTLR